MGLLRCAASPASASLSLTHHVPLRPQIAIWLGISLREEEAGNRVERVSAEQIGACLAEHGLQAVGVDRYAMYYQHEPRRAMRVFSRRRSFPAARIALVGFNRQLGCVGNKLSVRAVRAGVTSP